MERLQEETKRRAEQYAAQLQVAAPSAARAGGRQVKKAQLRKQAAAAGVDVLTWATTLDTQRRELKEAVGAGEAWPRLAWGRAELEQRL